MNGGAIVVVVAALITACQSVAGRESHVLTLHPQPAKPYPGPPTALVMLIQYSNGVLSVPASYARQANVDAVRLEDRLDHILAGEEAPFSYRVLADDGAVVHSGYFVIPLVTVMTYTSSGEPRRPVHATSPLTTSVARVTAAYSPLAQRVEMAKLTPMPGAPPERWEAQVVDTIVLGRIQGQ
jgi:hypothetical protein